MPPENELSLARRVALLEEQSQSLLTPGGDTLHVMETDAGAGPSSTNGGLGDETQRVGQPEGSSKADSLAVLMTQALRR